MMTVIQESTKRQVQQHSCPIPFPRTVPKHYKASRNQARIQIEAPHRTIHSPEGNQISLHEEEEQAVAAPINGGRKREETKESTKWEKNPKRVKGSRKNRIANRVKNKPDLEKKRGREGSALPAAMAAAPWNRRSRARAQLERKRRGEERPQWRIYCWLVTLCLGGKTNRKNGGAYLSLYLEGSRIAKRWANGGEQMVSPAQITLLPSYIIASVFARPRS